MQEKVTHSPEIVILGRYLIESVLGRSNDSAAFLVRDLHGKARDVPGKLFVLKEMIEPVKRARHRLASEGNLLRRLQHPGLPRVHQVLTDDTHNRVFLLMEYIDGHDLEILRQQQPEQRFSWLHIMSIMAPVIETVHYLHRQQTPIVHGDIKPANIIVQKGDGMAFLVDWVLLKGRDSVLHRDADRFRYWAPEHFGGGSIEVRTDIYALGATFFALATGKLPPDARSLQASSSDPLEFVQSAVPAIPLQKARAIARAMSLDAGRRFSSVEQFWDALWLVEESSSRAPEVSFMRESPPSLSGPGPLQPTLGPDPEQPSNGSTSGSPVGKEDPVSTFRLPREPKRETATDRIEERENPEASVRLPQQPLDILRAGRAETQKEPNTEKTPDVPS